MILRFLEVSTEILDMTSLQSFSSLLDWVLGINRALDLVNVELGNNHNTRPGHLNQEFTQSQSTEVSALAVKRIFSVPFSRISTYVTEMSLKLCSAGRIRLVDFQ
jgi:hypothetical protein